MKNPMNAGRRCGRGVLLVALMALALASAAGGCDKTDEAGAEPTAVEASGEPAAATPAGDGKAAKKQAKKQAKAAKPATKDGATAAAGPPDKPNETGETDKPGETDKADKADKPGETDKADKADKPDKPDRPDETGKPDEADEAKPTAEPAAAKAGDPEAQPAAPPAAPKPAEGVPAGAADAAAPAPTPSGPAVADIVAAAQAVKRLEVLAAQVCACQDSVCGDIAFGGLELAAKQSGKLLLEVKDSDRIKAAVERAVGCRATQPSPSAVAAATKPATPEAVAAPKPEAGAAATPKPEVGVAPAAAGAAPAAPAATDAAAPGAGDAAQVAPAQPPQPPAAPPGRYPRGKVTRVAQLPDVAGREHLTELATRMKAETIDALWGQPIEKLEAAYPSAVRQPPTDLRPFLDVLDVDVPRSKHTLQMSFLRGQLFLVAVDVRRDAPGLEASVAAIFGGKLGAERSQSEAWHTKARDWTDGNLVVSVRMRGKIRELVVADRERFERFLELDRTPWRAWYANRRGLSLHFKRPLKRNYEEVEDRYREALRILPTYLHAHVNLCHLYWQQRQFGDAKRHCKLARNSRNPTAQAEAALYEGLINMAMGNRSRAENRLWKARQYRGVIPAVVRRAQRAVDIVRGKGTTEQFEEVWKEATCALAEGDDRRVLVITKSYGFVDLPALRAEALRERVKVDRWQAEMRKRCLHRGGARGGTAP